MKKKIMEEIDIFEATVNSIRDLITDTKENDYDKLVNDLNLEKGLEIEKKKIGIKLDKVNISKIIVDKTQKSVICEKYLHYI